MTAIPYAIVQGTRHSFASIELAFALPTTLGGGKQPYPGVKSVEYSQTGSPTMVYGTNPDPIGKTRGKNEYKCKIELYLAEFNDLQKKLGPGWSEVPFNIEVAYTENGFDTIVDTIQGCTLRTLEASNSEGTEALTRSFEVFPTKILFNGVDGNRTPLTALPQVA